MCGGTALTSAERQDQRAARREPAQAPGGSGGAAHASCAPSAPTSPSSLDLGLELDAEAPRARAGGPRPSARPRRRWWPRRGSPRSWRASRRSRAPPTVSPRQPASSSSTPALRPSARSSSGFLKVEPKVLMPDGWAALRRARMSASVAFTSAGSASSSRKEACGHHLARAQVGVAVARTRSPSGPRRSMPAGVATSTHSSTAGQVAAVGVGVHLHRAAHGAGDVHAELQAGQALARGPRGHRRQPGAAAAEQARAIALGLRRARRRASLTSPRNPASATRRFDPEPITPTWCPSASAQASSSTSRSGLSGRA